MSIHRFIITAHTDPAPGGCHTPESLGNAIARILKGSVPNVDSVQFMVMDTPTDAGDFHKYNPVICNGNLTGDCKCGEAKDHPVHTMPHTWGGIEGTCGDSPCIIPDCQGERYDVVHNVENTHDHTKRSHHG